MILVAFVVLMLIAGVGANLHAARALERHPTAPYLRPGTPQVELESGTFARLASVSDAVPLETVELNTREKGWMQTYSGRRFYPLEPRAEDVELADVAHGLAMTCRYGGQCRSFYSVAEHCVLVSEFVELHARNAGKPAAEVRRLAQLALMHDSAEAYIGDMIRPLKHQPEMVAFRHAEAIIEQAIAEKFRLDWTLEAREIVKRIDDRILIDEISYLMPCPEAYLDTPLLRELSPLGVRFQCLSPVAAQGAFMHRYRELFT